MCENASNVPVGVTSNYQQAAGRPLTEAHENQKEYYLEQARRFCPGITEEMDDEARLSLFRKRVARFAEVLALIERPWAEEMPALQKACLSYLATASLSRKESRQISEAWTAWTNLHLSFDRYRILLAEFQQAYRLIGQELAALLSSPASSPAPEAGQEEQQKGGV